MVWGPSTRLYGNDSRYHGDKRQLVDANKGHCTEGVFGLKPEAGFRLQYTYFLFYIKVWITIAHAYVGLNIYQAFLKTSYIVTHFPLFTTDQDRGGYYYYTLIYR